MSSIIAMSKIKIKKNSIEIPVFELSFSIISLSLTYKHCLNTYPGPNPLVALKFNIKQNKSWPLVSENI